MSCKNSNEITIPNDIVGMEKMSTIIYKSQFNIENKGISAQNIKNDSLSLAEYKGILKQENITIEMFDKSLKFYFSNPVLADSLTALIIKKAQ